MVPACSDKVSRVSSYSGYRHVNWPFAYGTFTLSGLLSQNSSARSLESIMRSEPHGARTMVWPLSISLAATLEIDVSFSSSGYLDVSVHRVPFHTLWIGVWITELFSVRFPHSDIHGSLLMCSSPRLFAAYHVLHRLLVPRHPPCALLCFIRCIALHLPQKWVWFVNFSDVLTLNRYLRINLLSIWSFQGTFPTFTRCVLRFRFAINAYIW